MIVLQSAMNSPEGCRKLAWHNMPGCQFLMTSRPGGALEAPWCSLCLGGKNQFSPSTLHDLGQRTNLKIQHSKFSLAFPIFRPALSGVVAPCQT
jgi:hypothetical protein